jgi:hypothetical protein
VISIEKEPTFVSESLRIVFDLKDMKIVKRNPIINFHLGMPSWPLEKLKRKKTTQIGTPPFTKNLLFGSRVLIKRGISTSAQKRRDQVDNNAFKC